jgi:[acyl-carrier-protein] S-malonyltransferase
LNIAVVFPGQGSQNKDMADSFSDVSSFNDVIDQGSEILNYDVREAIKDEQKVNDTIYTQPLMLTISYAMWDTLIKKTSIKANIGAGHSLGEYTALVANNTISFQDALMLVKKRAEFMSSAMVDVDGAMAAVIGLDGNKVRDICREASKVGAIIEAVNFNCPGQTVIAGHTVAVEDIATVLKTSGAKIVKKLPVSLAAHTSLLKSVSNNLRDELRGINFNLENSFDVIHNYDLSVSKNEERLIDCLSMQVCSPVRWIETMQTFKSNDVSDVIEVGPGNVLQGLVKRFDKTIRVHSFSNIEDINSLQQVL